MAEIHFSAVYDAVTLKLRELMPNAHIYDSKIDQNLQSGDFHIVPVAVSDRKELASRRRQSVTVDIIYYTQWGDSVGDCLRAASKLAEPLKLIETVGGDRLHGECIESNIDEEDCTLHIIMKYSYFAKRDSSEGVMSQIESEVNYG